MTLVGLGRQRLHADLLDALGYVGPHGTGRRNPSVQDMVHHLSIGETLPNLLAGGGFPEHDARGIDVGAPIDAFSGDLLGRHVPELTFDDTGLRFGPVAAGELGDAEIEDLRLTVVGHEHVLRRHVAMDQPETRTVEVGELMRVVKTVERVGNDPQVLRERERARALG